MVELWSSKSKVELPQLARTPVSKLPTALAKVDQSVLTPGALVEVVAATQRLLRHYEGVQLQALAKYAQYYEMPADAEGKRPRSANGVRAKRFGAKDVEELSEFAPHEICGALALSPVSAGRRLGLAQDLADRLPATRDAVTEGRLDGWKARLIAEKTRVLPRVAALIVEAQILPGAPRLSRGKLESELERLIIAADPDGATARHTKARAARRCWTQPTGDGMGRFAAEVPADDLRTVWNALDAKAWAAQDLGIDTQRTLDQLRVDALVQLCAESLDKSHQGKYIVPDHRSVSEAALSRLAAVIRRRTVISVHVSAEVLTGDSDDPVYLAGHGWVPAPVARRLLGANAVIRRIIDDPVTGAPLDVSKKTYRPDEGMAEMVRQRDWTCTFPTCNAPSAQSDLDHVTPHPHGHAGPPRPGDLHETSVEGLHPPCRREHRLKTHGGWTVARLNDRWEWTSPLGKVYVSVGPAYTPRQLKELEIAERVAAEHAAEAAADAKATAAAKTRLATATTANDPPPF